MGDPPKQLPALELSFDEGSNKISLTVFEHSNGHAVPLNLQYEYREYLPDALPLASPMQSDEC